MSLPLIRVDLTQPFDALVEALHHAVKGLPQHVPVDDRTPLDSVLGARPDVVALERDLRAIERELAAPSVTEEEIRRAIVDRARQLPGHEQQVWEYYQKNPQAVAAVRAPIFEDKVVDFVVELATVTEKEVSREELSRDEDEEKPVAS